MLLNRSVEIEGMHVIFLLSNISLVGQRMQISVLGLTRYRLCVFCRPVTHIQNWMGNSLDESQSLIYLLMLSATWIMASVYLCILLLPCSFLN